MVQVPDGQCCVGLSLMVNAVSQVLNRLSLMETAVSQLFTGMSLMINSISLLLNGLSLRTNVKCVRIDKRFVARTTQEHEH